MPLGYVILSKVVPWPLPYCFMLFSWAPSGLQCCLYILLERQPENSWPLGGKCCIISNPSRYSGFHLPCFLQHVQRQHLSMNPLRWETGTQRLLEVHLSASLQRQLGFQGTHLPLWELALQAIWAQSLTALLLKLQTYPWVKSPLQFYGTFALLVNLFLSQLVTPTTRTLPPCRQHCFTPLIIKILLKPLTGPDNPLLCHYFCYCLK